MGTSRMMCVVLLPACLAACAPTGDTALLSAEASRLSPQRRPAMSKDELRVTCSVLEQVIVGEIGQMKELEKAARIEKNTLPSTLLHVWQRAFGEDGEGVLALQTYEKKRKRIEAMNAELASRGCPTVDIESALKIPIEPAKARN